jgi:hypothetical protein
LVLKKHTPPSGRDRERPLTHLTSAMICSSPKFASRNGGTSAQGWELMMLSLTSSLGTKRLTCDSALYARSICVDHRSGGYCNNSEIVIHFLWIKVPNFGPR